MIEPLVGLEPRPNKLGPRVCVLTHQPKRKTPPIFRRCFYLVPLVGLEPTL